MEFRRINIGLKIVQHVEDLGRSPIRQCRETVIDATSNFAAKHVTASTWVCIGSSAFHKCEINLDRSFSPQEFVNKTDLSERWLRKEDFLIT
jgi:hypothetical protein